MPDDDRAALAEVEAALAAYRHARNTIHAAVVRAHELGMPNAEIARQGGMSRAWVGQILRAQQER